MAATKEQWFAEGQARSATGWPTASRLQRAKATARGAGARALLIPLGAALLAGERLREEFGGVAAAYASQRRGVAEQLRRIERRGRIARNRLEREVRLARMRLERRMRDRRRDLRERRVALSADLSTQVATAQEQLRRSRRWLAGRTGRGKREGGRPLVRPEGATSG